jgi:hypothetical protein
MLVTMVALSLSHKEQHRTGVGGVCSATSLISPRDRVPLTWQGRPVQQVAERGSYLEQEVGLKALRIASQGYFPSASGVWWCVLQWPGFDLHLREVFKDPFFHE